MFSLKIDSELELRILEERHGAELFELSEKNRQYLKKWLPWLDVTQSVADTRSFISHSLAGFAKGSCLVTGIWFSGKLVGVISFHAVNQASRKTSVGYWLDVDHQGKGIATRACRAMVNYAFHELKLNRVEIACATENFGSQAIPVRLGMKEEGRSRQTEWLYDHFVDHVNYAIIASEWK